MFSIFINGERYSTNILEVNDRQEIMLEDASIPLFVEICRIPEKFRYSNWCIFFENCLIANSGSFASRVEGKDIEAVKQSAMLVIDDRQEVFTHTHGSLPNNKRPRVIDKTENVKRLLDTLAEEISVKTPPVEHNKIGIKSKGVFNLTKLHVDRFAGMRNGCKSTRRRVSRHFVNLGDSPRNVCFAIMDPKLVDLHVPDEYNSTYLDDLVKRFDGRLSILMHEIPTRINNIFFSCRYLATHLLHCEYGPSPDLVALVNSDSESRPELCG